MAVQSPNAPSVSAQSKNIYDQFKQQRPQLEQQALGGYGDSARRDLAQRMQGNRNVASKRGLLYSGQYGQAQNQAVGDFYTGLNRKKMELQDAFRDQEQNYLKQALSDQYGDRDFEQSKLDIDLLRALKERENIMQNKAANQGLLGNIFGALGSVGGAAAARG